MSFFNDFIGAYLESPEYLRRVEAEEKRAWKTLDLFEETDEPEDGGLFI